jgi:hypothetical protein
MLKDASKRKFDVIMAWAIDRLGRSLIDLLGTIQTLEACGVDLYLDQQAIDTTTPAGRLMFQVCGAFAVFERSIIRQRVHAGLKRAVAQSKQLGRPRIDAAILSRKRKSQIASRRNIACRAERIQGLVQPLHGHNRLKFASQIRECWRFAKPRLARCPHDCASAASNSSDRRCDAPSRARRASPDALLGLGAVGKRSEANAHQRAFLPYGPLADA